MKNCNVYLTIFDYNCHAFYTYIYILYNILFLPMIIVVGTQGINPCPICYAAILLRCRGYCWLIHYSFWLIGEDNMGYTHIQHWKENKEPIDTCTLSKLSSFFILLSVICSPKIASGQGWPYTLKCVCVCQSVLFFLNGLMVVVKFGKASSNASTDVGSRW